MSAVDRTYEAPRVEARPSPVEPKARMFNLDMLRGWAVLGILAVNAAAFAWPITVMMAGDFPPLTAAHADRVGTWVVDVFFADKFRTLFSMLFGVSIFLVGGEREDEVRGKLLRSRLFWLALFGAIHGAALWYGDILLHYAYCGLIVALVRSWPASRLLWVGGGVTLAWMVIGAGLGAMTGLFGDMGAAPQSNPFMPTPESIAATVEVYRSGWPGAQIENLKAWGMVQGFSLFMIPATVPLMMLGLGLFKSGYLPGRSATWLYLLVIALTAVVLAATGWVRWANLGAPGDAGLTGLAKGGQALAPLITLGYASLLILLTRWGLKAVTRILAPVGQMAFTNYLTQTLIMTSLFYMPWGPMLFGEVGPATLWLYVGAIWLLQLIWSPLWLSRFQLGPLEWVWRCLTYGRRVPLLRRG